MMPSRKAPEQLALHLALRDDATLENFYAGRNALACASVTALAEGTGEPFVYLWGESGAGCSHLLQAACHHAAACERQSLYLPGRDLGLYGPEMLEGLESLDLVCLDGVQHLVGDSRWEEALFGFFNRVRDAGTALLIAADRPPRQLEIRLPDLASRLSWGVVFALAPLSDEEKTEVLRLRARNRGFELSEEAAQYILNRSPRGMGELFALLERLDKASLHAQRRVTIPFIKQTLGW